MRIRYLLILSYIAWLAAWFWTFSFGFSQSFFSYHLATRIPVLILALFAVAVPPLACYWTIRRAMEGHWSLAKAVAVNLAANAAPLLFFWGVLAVWVNLARASGHNAFEADEAMGNGITFMLCVAVSLAFGLLVPLILGGWTWWQRRSAKRG